MTTSPFNTEKLKREVYCPQCKKTIVSTEANPTCEECYGKPMITVVYSIVDGKRITGTIDELGPGSS